jgi:thiamine pyrophosphate-dependent acetolactate synthase large subunit-like protein
VIEQLAEKSGALLGTSLLGKGMFDHHPFSLNIVGGYARQAARDVAQDVDLVITFGASLGRFTLDGGKMFPKAEIVQIDLEPKGYREGIEGIDMFARADAKLAAAALLEKLGNTKTKANVRSPELSKRLKDMPFDSTIYPDNGMLDPRDVINTLEGIIPTDYDLVSGNGHSAFWHAMLRGAAPANYHATRGFGAIGNALPFAMGIAATRKDGRVVLFEGDGGLIMHIQELESLKREKVKVLVVCLNDAAFGAEIHKLREEKIDDQGVVFGFPPFEQIAKGFGVRGATVTKVEQFKDLMKEYEAGDTAMIWDVRISDQVMAPNMRDDVGYGKKK